MMAKVNNLSNLGSFLFFSVKIVERVAILLKLYSFSKWLWKSSYFDKWNKKPRMAETSLVNILATC